MRTIEVKIFLRVIFLLLILAAKGRRDIMIYKPYYVDGLE
jgi:hypothetical protein